MKTIEDIKKNLNNQKSVLKEKYNVRRMGLFGSFVRGEQTNDSDVDIIVDYAETPSLFSMIELEQYLEKVLDMKVDLVTMKGIKPRLKEHIIKEVDYI